MATTATLLDNLPAPSTDGVDRVYHQLKDILGITAAQQVESSLQHQAEVSIMSSGHSKVGWQKVATEAPVIGMTSSPARISAHVWLSHLDRCQVPPAHRQAHRGDKDAHFRHHVWNLTTVDVTTRRDATSILRE
jgi:GMP synthase-like glutamine amidotransferase